MTAEEIKQYLAELNDELSAINVKGEICLYGGAVMCIAFNARPATKDVDAVFEPVRVIAQAANKIAERHNLAIDWLNNGVKMFLVEHEKEILFDWLNLKVYVPSPDYLLAMKTLAARANTSDRADIEFLIDRLNLQKAEQVFEVVKNYYPRKETKPATQFFIEELFEQKQCLP
jgi:hypothetical protein